MIDPIREIKLRIRNIKKKYPNKIRVFTISSTAKTEDSPYLTPIRSSKKIGLFLWKIFDLKIVDGFGPDGISAMIKKFSIKANKFQSGFIYQYAFVMLIGFSALLTFLIIK